MGPAIRSLPGFLFAGIAAPPASVTIYLLLSRIVGEGSRPHTPIGPDLPLVYLFASLLGTIPSLMFGGLTLVVMKAVLKSWPARSWALATGGSVAATLCCVAFIFIGMAPWGPRPLENPQSTASMAISIVLAGGVAGLIYARSTQKG